MPMLLLLLQIPSCTVQQMHFACQLYNAVMSRALVKSVTVISVAAAVITAIPSLLDSALTHTIMLSSSYVLHQANQ
jgi:hypothetical protein